MGLRTGDTPQRERQAMRRKPPDILVTTPESLYLISVRERGRSSTGVEAVIVDEIHAVAQSKRGCHLALTLERLDHLVRTNAQGGAAGASDEVAEQASDPAAPVASQPAGNGAEGEAPGGVIPLQRIGLSATQRPLERIAKFLAGSRRRCEVVDAGIRRQLDLEIVVMPRRSARRRSAALR